VNAPVGLVNAQDRLVNAQDRIRAAFGEHRAGHALPRAFIEWYLGRVAGPYRAPVAYRRIDKSVSHSTGARSSV
jgi:hypothetical protein